MQLGNTFQGKKCTRCRQVIQSDPAFDDDLWYHRTCLEEGTRALHRAQELAARFGVGVGGLPRLGGARRHRIGSLGSDGTRNRCKPVITFAELLLAAKKAT